jgi:uncharacterized protein
MQRLIVELSAIPPEGITYRFRSTVVALGIDDPEVAVVQPLEMDCQFVKVNRDVVVHGTLRSAVRLTCSRCAEEFVQPLLLALDAMYLPIDDLSSARAKALEDDVTDVYAYAESVIDLVEMVRDKLFLSIPLQPHCRAGCQGLCPSCGVNRNTVRCQCAEEKLGSPFELLKELRFS